MMNNTIKSLGLAAAFMVAGVGYGAGEKTLADVGQTNIGPNDPNVGLIDRGAINPEYAGTYALVFSNAQTTTFTFNSPWAVKEFLVVGGGGAGGGNGGGGGGGGGVIYFTENLLAADNVQTNFENGQSISLTIGAGGKGAFKMTGMAGGHSVLTLGEKTYTAFGGGGGGNYKEAPSTSQDPMPGAGGNTGCGAGQYRGDKNRPGDSTTMPDLPGYYGTNGGAGDGSACGGGGGAGQVGGDAPSGSQGGKGGDGLPCSITGAEVYYAAGGGGGDTSGSKKNDRAEGGEGGGGRGSYDIGRLTPNDTTKAPAEANATGFGCGGGGGMGGGGKTCVGGNGSAGIVVLLIEPVEIVAEKPVVSVLVPEQGANYAKFSVSVVADGLDNKTESEVWGGWAKEGDAITCAKLADAVAVNGSVAKTVTGLEVGAKYDYKFYAVNGEGTEGDAVTGTITLVAGGVDPTSAAPVIVNQECTVLGNAVNIPYCVAWPGKDKETCSVTLKYGLLANKLSYSVDLGSGLIGNGSTQVAGLIPGRKYFFQLTADNGMAQGTSEVFTAVIADEATYPATLDPRQPVIAGVGGVENFVLGGDGILYSGAFSNYVNGTMVTFHYSKDNEVWESSVAAVTSEGFKVAVESGLEVSTDYSYYFTAEAGDFADCTQVKVFNTKGPAKLAEGQEDVTWLQNPNPRLIGMRCNVTDVGAGTNTEVCLMITIGNQWVEISSMPVDHTGLYDIWSTAEEASILNYGSGCTIRVSIRNTTFGGRTWEYPSITAARGYTRVDGTTYTWTGGDGLWDAAASWTPAPYPLAAGAAGYPVYGSTAKFDDNAVATVRIGRAEWMSSFQFGSSTDVKLSFNVPQDGLDAAMVRTEYSGVVFPNGDSPVTIAIDPSSGFFRRDAWGSQRLISCAGGIDTNRVKCVSPHSGRSTFHYEWPKTDPNHEGNPTELWLDVDVAPKGFRLFVR